MGTIRRFLRRDRDYFAASGTEILQQNASALRMVCTLYLLILVGFTAVTAAASRSALLLHLYYVYDGIHLALCAAVLLHPVKTPGGYWHTGACRAAFEISLLSFFVLEAVFPFPDQQSLFFPFPIILLVMVFIYRPWKVLVLVTGYVGAFVALVFRFKAPEVWGNELYIAAGTLIFSLVGYATVAALRHENSQTMSRLRDLSMTDIMTGLYNKQTFELLCREFLEQEPPRRAALLFFDVDKFKCINDRYGHPFGDTVLKGTAAALRGSFCDRDYLCRYGGDEFVAFVADADSEAAVWENVRRFSEQVGKLADTLHIDALSCSVGAALHDRPAESYESLLSRADKALYAAKEVGNRTVFDHREREERENVGS